MTAPVDPAYADELLALGTATLYEAAQARLRAPSPDPAGESTLDIYNLRLLA